MGIPTNLKYTAEHEWLDIADDVATVGITSFAVEALGDVVYVELPALGSTVVAGQPCGEIESTKSVSDIYAPVDGEVVAVNGSVVDYPGLVNTDPFTRGWLFRLRITGTPDLLHSTAYESLVGGE